LTAAGSGAGLFHALLVAYQKLYTELICNGPKPMFPQRTATGTLLECLVAASWVAHSTETFAAMLLAALLCVNFARGLKLAKRQSAAGTANRSP